MTDLKPCPFCDDPMEIWDNGEMARHSEQRACPLRMRAFPIDAWNRRAPDPRDEAIRGLSEALIEASANLATVARTDGMYEVQRKQCQAWSDEAFAAAWKLTGKDK